MQFCHPLSSIVVVIAVDVPRPPISPPPQLPLQTLTHNYAFKPSLNEKLQLHHHQFIVSSLSLLSQTLARFTQTQCRYTPLRKPHPPQNPQCQTLPNQTPPEDLPDLPHHPLPPRQPNRRPKSDRRQVPKTPWP